MESVKTVLQRLHITSSKIETKKHRQDNKKIINACWTFVET